MSKENIADDSVSDDNNDDILQEAVVYMKRFLTIAGKIVDDFRNGDYSQLNDIFNLFEGFHWIYIAVIKIRSEYNAEIPIDTDRVEEALETAAEAIKNSDVDLLTDTLEYDFIEIVREWYGNE